MKNYALTLLAFIALSFTAMSQEKAEKAVPAPALAKAAFNKSFAGATKVKWEKEKNDYEVNFEQNGKKMSAVYDSKGTLKETETEIKVAELPATAVDYIKQHYKGNLPTGAAKITDAAGVVTYEAELKGKDVIFDASGKFIREAKD